MLKRLSLALTLLMVLIASSIVTSHVSFAKEGGLVNFTPILQLDVKTGNLNGTIEPGGKAVNVPVTVKYRVNVPGLFAYLPPLLRNMLIYGNMIVPPMKVHLSIVNKPDWMDVSIASPDIYIDIKENAFSYANTSLSIAIYKDAPAQPYTLILRAESDAMGKVTSQSVEAQFKITPGYIPLVTINTDKPLREAGPMTTVTFPIKIANNANKETVVKLIDYDTPPGWAVQPSQNQIIIPQGKEATLSLSVTTPAGFGWMPNQVQQIKLKFIALPSPPPLSYEETTSNTYTYSVGIRSGSAPMIGIVVAILVIVAIIIALIVVIVRRKA